MSTIISMSLEQNWKKIVLQVYDSNDKTKLNKSEVKKYY